MNVYEVLTVQPGLLNGCDGYISLGVHHASSPRAAANKALRAVAEEPYDTEGAPIVGPDPTILVLPLRRMAMFVENLKVPPEIIEAWEDA